ncbi:12576_t:CDS:10 [Acaulospora morrowiae]|uniref:12576_t:CDS:1 n=1 Tax=Acaulospora morrowiae TaxID=94023 RepID=A0A9N9C5H6_9GLOM|nr:12576_t:CDS:10 [Acaulospora morrowiae]
MDFTESFKQSLNLCRFSPDLKYLAIALENAVVVRETETFQVSFEFKQTSNIQSLEWSPDSTLVLAANFANGEIVIRDVNDPTWKRNIREGPAGLMNVKWNPDSRSVMCFSDFQLRITIWSLITNKGYYIQDPKYHNKGFCFREDPPCFILAERRECKDYIGVYKCNTDDWKLINVFQVDTVDLDNFALSPNGQYIVVWENCIWYKIIMYTLDGQCVGNFSIDNEGLGVKSIAWSPSSKLVAVGGYDQKIRLFNNHTWTPIKELMHSSRIKDTQNLKIWKEAREYSPGLGRFIVKYDLIEKPIEVPLMQPSEMKPNPKSGVGTCKFNANGSLIVTLNDNMPNCLWIWDVNHLNLIALIIQLNSVKNFYWNPVEADKLVICCGNEFVYFWCGQDQGTEIIEVPSVNFKVYNMSWRSDGKSILMMDKTRFCVSFITDRDNSELSE